MRIALRSHRGRPRRAGGACSSSPPNVQSRWIAVNPERARRSADPGRGASCQRGDNAALRPPRPLSNDADVPTPPPARHRLDSRRGKGFDANGGSLEYVACSRDLDSPCRGREPSPHRGYRQVERDSSARGSRHGHAFIRARHHVITPCCLPRRQRLAVDGQRARGGRRPDGL